jgi:hypothetical protein
MGKDREGKFHPQKGKPSGSGKTDQPEVTSPVTGSLESYLELADKYTEGPDEQPANVKVRHPNRNVDKNGDRRQTRTENKKNTRPQRQRPSEDEIGTRPEELPGILSKELFAELAAFHSQHCVSIYMQTHRTGVEVNEQRDQTIFKNYLQQVTTSLKQKNIDQAIIDKIIAPGYALINDAKFWSNMSAGLAVFIAEDFFKYIKMPEAPTAELLVNSSFFLKPLVNSMTVKEYFYLLVISKKQAKVFKADNFGITLVEIPEMPNGVEDVVHFEEKDDKTLFRTDTAGAGKGASYHGHGSGTPDEKEHLSLYLEEVDETLWEEVLHNDTAPLLLAGVEYLLPIFKSVSGYKNIWPEVLKGSHEHDDLNSLYTEARALMEPWFRERTLKALTNYGNQSATALTSPIAEDVIPAAHYGRVWHLFVRPNEHIWGTFDEKNNELRIHESKQDDDECLIDKAVIKTILNGGDVHFLSREDMPEDTSMAALMRY